MTNLVCLNGIIGADVYTREVCQDLTTSLDRPPVGAEFGIAYGGSTQQIGRIFKPVGGVVHGFDTFAGHPRQCSYSQTAFEATCMDGHYGYRGYDALSYEYQRKVLDDEGLDNVILHKGLINDNSLDGIPPLDYCLLDVDMVAVMVHCWQLVRKRTAPGGWLCLHDVVPRDHMPGLWGLYQEIVATNEYHLIHEVERSMLVVLRRKP